MRVDSMERNPRRVEVMSPSLATSEKPMREVMAPIHEAISLGKRKSLFAPRRSLACPAKIIPPQTTTVVNRLRTV